MNALSAQIMHASGPETGRKPAMGNGPLASNTYYEGTRGDITIRMISRLNRLLGTYSKMHEARIANDIKDVIGHIRTSEDNARMHHPSRNLLGRDPAEVFKTLYKSSKNIALEFSHLMNEGVVEAGAEATHNDGKIRERRENAGHIIWVLALELRLIRGMVRHEANDHIVNEKLAEVVERFVSLMEKDMDVFCKVHGIERNYVAIIPPPSTMSPE